MALGHQPGGSLWMAKGWAYDADQRVSEVDAWVDGSPLPGGVVSRHDLSYDEVGNLDEKNVFMNGFNWQECYGYDDRQRLTDAYTVTSGGDCSTGTPGTGNFGFEHSYTYSADGKLTERTEGSTTDTYSYPASGGTRPHAPTSVNGDSYTWDANGNLTERTVNGDTETFSWDVQQQLESVDGPDGETSFVYNASGQRLLRQTDDGATLYLAGHEVTANSDGSEVSAVRSYSFGGQMIATRSADGVDYLITDEAGSVEMSVPDQGLPETSRAYDPYGNVRVHGGPEFDTDKGFVGQIEDSTSSLSYLNARYYDTSIGVFISTDPIYDTASIKTLNPYTYASGNPASFADPAGTSRSYIWGMERQNAQLRQHNAELRGIIKRLGNQIEDLQGIIKRQNREMQKMLTHIRALEATIRQQASIINQLVQKVNELAAQVAYWRNQAQYWYGRAQYWKGQAMYWQGEAIKWKGKALFYEDLLAGIGGAFTGGSPGVQGFGPPTPGNIIDFVKESPAMTTWCAANGALACGIAAASGFTATKAANDVIADHGPDAGNAFVHAYWMGLTAYGIGGPSTLTLGIAYEIDSWIPGNWQDTVRDMWNNSVGITHGTQAWNPASIDDGVMRSLERGDLYCTEGGLHRCRI